MWVDIDIANFMYDIMKNDEPNYYYAIYHMIFSINIESESNYKEITFT
jgi:hypothetical protein